MREASGTESAGELGQASALAMQISFLGISREYGNMLCRSYNMGILFPWFPLSPGPSKSLKYELSKSGRVLYPMFFY